MNAFLEKRKPNFVGINPCERRSKNGNSVDKDDRHEAAEIIQHNDMVAFSGFTPRVRRKPYPPRLPAELTNSMSQKAVSNSPSDGCVNQRRR